MGRREIAKKYQVTCRNTEPPHLILNASTLYNNSCLNPTLLQREKHLFNRLFSCISVPRQVGVRHGKNKSYIYVVTNWANMSRFRPPSFSRLTIFQVVLLHARAQLKGFDLLASVISSSRSRVDLFWMTLSKALDPQCVRIPSDYGSLDHVQGSRDPALSFKMGLEKSLLSLHSPDLHII